MQEANFSDADLRLADFSLTGLQLAVFINSKLQGVDFSEAKMQGTDFERARMQGVNLFRGGLQGAVFEQTMMHGAHSENSDRDGEERLRDYVGRETDCPCSAFGGYLEADDVENLVNRVSKRRRGALRTVLLGHVGKARESEAPDGVEAGSYTLGQVEEWIRESDI